MAECAAPGRLNPDRTNAVAWSASANQTATILGPALSGLLYAAGPALVYTTAGGLSLSASLFISGTHMERTPSVREPVSLESLFAGIAFIRSRPAILGVISLDLFAVLLGGVGTLVVTLLWMRLFPELARIESLKYRGRSCLQVRAGGIAGQGETAPSADSGLTPCSPLHDAGRDVIDSALASV